MSRNIFGKTVRLLPLTMWWLLDILMAIFFVIVLFVWFYTKRPTVHQDSLTAETASVEKSSVLAAYKDKLDAASQEWKKRVEVKDNVTFSVAGRMTQEAKDLPESLLAVAANGDKKKRTPKANRFRGKEGTLS